MISCVRGGSVVTALAVAVVALVAAPSVSAAEPVLKRVTYPDTTTYSCHTDAIDIHPGQNINDFATSKTCPHAEVVSGPGSADVFKAGSTAEGFMTRFKPSMVEIKPSGKLVVPSVWDLHLHHVVWLLNGNPTFGSGEEKTISSAPEGYGLKVKADQDWYVNQMLHNLGASDNRQVYLTWEIDWVPAESDSGAELTPTNLRWMDVAGTPQVYPVFDAEKGYDTNGDGKFVFPDEADSPSDPANAEEGGKISNSRRWVVGNANGVTLLNTAGHLHPGGVNTKMMVARDGPDAGTVDGDDPSEIKDLFRSDAKYYEPAGAVSWDVSMGATPRSWRISLKQGDTVFITVTYDVSRASWYESMGIMAVSWVPGHDDPLARDPFDDAADVQAMYDAGGVLTHGRLPENIDKKARKDLGLADPRKLRNGPKVPSSGIGIRGFNYLTGGFTAVGGFPRSLMKPPTVKSGQTVAFTNLDALSTQTNEQQAWHSITSCKAPCNKGSGIGYPLANGPVKFDSGQLGYGKGLSSGVTTGSNVYGTMPALPFNPNKRDKIKTKGGKKKTINATTYTYFCRIHPLMRGSIRVVK